MKTFLQNLLKNWKTTLSGILILIVLYLRSSNFITPEVGDAIWSILASLGLVAAKDSNKTGV